MSDDTVIAVPRQRIERLEQRVAVLEALLARLQRTYEALPATIGEALEQALPIEGR